jgi:hypothetical protein
MRDQLLPMERVLAIQEALAGFIFEEVVSSNGTFHWDGKAFNDKSNY